MIYYLRIAYRYLFFFHFSNKYCYLLFFEDFVHFFYLNLFEKSRKALTCEFLLLHPNLNTMQRIIWNNLYTNFYILELKVIGLNKFSLFPHLYVLLFLLFGNYLTYLIIKFL